jgi:lipopolysaccharide export system protein LptA
MTTFLSDIILHNENDIQFKNSAGNNAGKISQTGDDLVLSNAVGDILLGSGSDDVYIGDGTSSVDIRFEQNMAIFADSATTKTLTIGGANTSLVLESPTITGTITDSTSSLAFLAGAQTFTGQKFFDAGFDAHPIMLSGSQNFDNIDRSGFYNLYNTSSGSTNPPPGGTYGTMIAIGNDKGSQGFGMQLFHQRTGGAGQLQVRGMNDSGSAWTSWNTVYTASDTAAVANGASTIATGDQIYDFVIGLDYLPKAGGTMSGAIAMGNQNITGAGTITGTTLTGTSLDINGNADISGTTTLNNTVYLSSTGLITWGGFAGGSGFGIRGESGRALSLGSNGNFDHLIIDTSGNATFAGDIALADNKKIKIGDNPDLQIYHNGSHSFIQDVGAGDLRLLASSIKLQNTSETDILTLASDLSATFEGKLQVNQQGNGTSNLPSPVAVLSGQNTASVVKALSLVNSVTGASGNGTQIAFHNASNYSPTGTITTIQDGDVVTDSKMEFQIYNGGLQTALTIDHDSNATFAGNLTAVNLNLTDTDGGNLLILNSSSGDGIIRWQDNGTQKWDIGRDNTDQAFVIANEAGLDDNQVVHINHSTGEFTLKGALTVGVDDTGHDVKFFGATSGKYMLWDESADRLLITDNTYLALGTDSDFLAFHSGSNGFLSNYTGHYYITNNADNGNIYFQSDDGSGGVTPYLTLDGSNTTIKIEKDTFVTDNTLLGVGDGSDLRMSHNGTNSFIDNYTGDFYIRQRTDDKDLILQCDDGSGGVESYFALDGGANANVSFKSIFMADNKRFYAGGGGDLGIYHDGTNNYIDNTNGDLYIRNTHDDKDIIFQSDDGSGGLATYLQLDGSTASILVNRPTIFYDTLTVPTDIIHSGDTDTMIRFTSDNIRLQAGGNNTLELAGANATFAGSVTTDTIVINDTDSTRGVFRNDAGYDLRLGGGTVYSDGAYISLSGGIRGGGTSNLKGRIEMRSGGSNYSAQADITGDIVIGTQWNGGSSDILTLDSSTNAATFAGDVVINKGTTATATQTFRRDTSGDAAIIGDINFSTSAAEGTDDRVGLIRTSTQGGTSTTRGGIMYFFTRGANSSSFNTTSYNHIGSWSFPNDVTIAGDLTVNGTTVTVDTTNLNVQDKNITLNYSTGDSSASADGAGITIQDAVNSDTDATILWTAASDRFDFSHQINVTGAITSSGQITGTELEGTSLDINGVADISGALGVAGNATFTADVYVHHNDGLQLGDTGNNSTARTTLTSFADGGNSRMKIKGGNFIHSLRLETSKNDFQYADFNSSYNGSDTTLNLHKSNSDTTGTDATTTISTGTSTFAGDVILSSTAPTLRIQDSRNLNNPDWDNVSLGNIEFYTSDTTSPGARVLAEIEAFSNATAASGPNADLIFKTSEQTDSSPQTRLTIGHNGVSTFTGNVTVGSNSLTAGSLDINGNADISGTAVITSQITAGYGVKFTNGSTDFLLYNNPGEDVLYMRDTTNGAMITHWGVNDFKVYKNLIGTTATFNGSVTVGQDDTGHDVKFFGATSGRYLLWDESDDALEGTDNVRIKLGAAADLQIVHTGSDSYIHNTSNTNLYFKQSGVDTDIIFLADDGSGVETEYFRLDGSAATHNGSTTTGLYTNWPDYSVISLGTSHDLKLQHSGNTSYIENMVGDLYIKQNGNDNDIIFQSDDGSGGTTTYFFLDGSNSWTTFPDNKKATFGTGNDLQIYHDGSNSYLRNTNGNLYIKNELDDGDIIFESDDGSGGVAEYFRVDGSAELVDFSKGVVLNTGSYLQLKDSITAFFGTGNDLRIYHNGSNSYISQEGTGDLYIRNIVDDKNIYLQSDDGSGGLATYMYLDGVNAMLKIDQNTRVADSKYFAVGSGSDLQLSHDGSHSYMIQNGVGNLYIRQSVADADLILQCDDGSGGETAYITLDGSATNVLFSVDTILNGGGNYIQVDVSDDSLKFADNATIKLGTGNDLQIYHNATDSKIDNYTGDLYITNFADDKDIIFRSDDGAGGFETYFFLDGSASSGAGFTVFPDSSTLAIGDGYDMRFQHNGTNSYILNYTGNIEIEQNADDKDIILKADDGSGGTTAYLTLDGSEGHTVASKEINFLDGIAATFGNKAGGDLEIKEQSGNSYISNFTGNLEIINHTDDGDIIFKSDDGSGGIETYFYLDGSASSGDPYTVWPDNSIAAWGTGVDLRIQHTGSHAYIFNTTGNLEIINYADDSDIIFKSDDGSGGVETYFYLDGSLNTDGTPKTVFPDNSKLQFGSGAADLRLWHDATDSHIVNNTGDLYITNNTDDKDIIFQSDNGSGGTATYFKLDGGNAQTEFERNVKFLDTIELRLGTSNDLQIYHDGSNSYIKEIGTGTLRLQTNGAGIDFYKDSTEFLARLITDGAVELYYDSVKKFETASAGVKTAYGKTSTTDGDAAGDIVYFGGTTGMEVGEIYYLTSSGTWALADADAEATAKGMLAVALGGSSDTDGMLVRGFVTLDHDPGTVGDTLFLSTTAGLATATAPSGNGDIVRVIGYCLDSTNGQIYFNPDGTFVEVSA